MPPDVQRRSAPGATSVGMTPEQKLARVRAHRPLAMGDNSPEVRRDLNELQVLLGLQPTGVFDKKTRDAVIAFQKKNGLTVDGVVGQQTWGALLGGLQLPPGTDMLQPWARSFMHGGGALGGRYLGSQALAEAARSMHGDEFMQKLQQVSDRLGVRPEWLLKVMHCESGLKTDAVNPHSEATGLIQFMPATAAKLGTSVEALRQMSAVQQLDYVERYFQPYAGQLKSTADVYSATFYPAMIGQGDGYLLGGSRNAGLVARLNHIFDLNHSGEITAGEFRAFCLRRFGDDAQDVLEAQPQRVASVGWRPAAVGGWSRT